MRTRRVQETSLIPVSFCRWGELKIFKDVMERTK
jgi:hypothetical protein